MFCKKIKFEKIKQNDNGLIYNAVSDAEVQKVILEYCIDHNLEIKCIKISGCDICIKLKCSYKQANEFVLYMIKTYYLYFKNFKF